MSGSLFLRHSVHLAVLAKLPEAHQACWNLKTCCSSAKKPAFGESA